MDPKELGRRIKQFRLERNLSQSELAERINVSFQQVQKYEQGRSRLTLERLESIAASLEVPIGAFWEPEPPKAAEAPGEYSRTPASLQRLTAAEVSLLRRFRRIRSARMREAFLRLLKEIAEADADG